MNRRRTRILRVVGLLAALAVVAGCGKSNKLAPKVADTVFLEKWGVSGIAIGQLSSPRLLAIDGSGNVVMADAGSARLQRFDAHGVFQLNIAPPGGAPPLAFPWGVACGDDGSIYVSDLENVFIYKFSSAGTLQVFWRAGTENFGIALSSGQLYVAAGDDTVIRVFNTDSTLVRTIRAGYQVLQRVTGVAVADNGDLYVSGIEIGGDGSAVLHLRSDGTFVGRFGGAGLEDGQIQPENIDLAIGRDGHIYVTDVRGNRVQEFTPDGKFLSKWGTNGVGDGQFQGPIGVAVDKNNVIYVSEYIGDRVQKFGKVPGMLRP
jgi:DNA-binding beta-propeller fold protein YncE